MLIVKFAQCTLLPHIMEHLFDLLRSSFFPCYYSSFMWMSNAHDEKSVLMVFKHFLWFWTMQTHAQACVCWSKYTTSGKHLPHGRWTGLPESFHHSWIFVPGHGTLDYDLQLLRFQVWNKLGIAETFVVAHVGVDTWKRLN